MKLKKQIICKMKAKNTGKRPKRRRRPVKRLVETSEDVNKLKLQEQLDYNLDILFESILMHLIWRSGASEKKKWIRNIFISARESLTLLS